MATTLRGLQILKEPSPNERAILPTHSRSSHTLGFSSAHSCSSLPLACFFWYPPGCRGSLQKLPPHALSQPCRFQETCRCFRDNRSSMRLSRLLKRLMSVVRSDSSGT